MGGMIHERNKNPSHASHQFPFCPALALPSDIVESVATQWRSKNKNSREIRGCCSEYAILPSGKMGAEGLEPPTPSV